MTKLIVATIAASLVTLPSVASAQALPAPVIAIVDIQRVQTQCTACKTLFLIRPPKSGPAKPAAPRPAGPATGKTMSAP